jgi:predicted RNA binding protein YcfA (HicA-like mRNA interferase family)
MPKLPRRRGREVIATRKRAGFAVVRIKGSHHFLKHPDGRCTVVPVHAGEIIGVGLMKTILDDAEMTIEQFLELE